MANVRASRLELTGHPPLGIADGLFCAEACARRSLVLARRRPTRSGALTPLAVLGRKDVATTCQRLGLHTVGSFADLDSARVAERFNKHALVAASRGARRTLRTRRPARPQTRRTSRATARRGRAARRAVGLLRSARGRRRPRRRGRAPRASPPRGRRRGRGVTARRSGPRGPRRRSCRGVRPRASLRDVAPWPGQMRAPSPATTLTRPVAVQLRDENDRPVVMGRAGFSVRRPRRCCSRTSCAARSSGTRDRGRWSSGGGRSIAAARTSRSCSPRARRCCSPRSRVAGGSRGSTTDALRRAPRALGLQLPRRRERPRRARRRRRAPRPLGTGAHRPPRLLRRRALRRGGARLRSAHGLRHRDLDRRRRRPRRGPRPVGRAPRRARALTRGVRRALDDARRGAPATRREGRAALQPRRGREARARVARAERLSQGRD